MVAVCDVAGCSLGSLEFDDIWRRPDLVTSLLEIHEIRRKDAIEAHFVAVKSLKLLDVLATITKNINRKEGTPASESVLDEMWKPKEQPKSGVEFESEMRVKIATAARARREAKQKPA